MNITHPNAPFDPRAEAMLPAVGGFPPSDRPLFLAGYGELCRIDLSGKRALRVHLRTVRTQSAGGGDPRGAHGPA